MEDTKLPRVEICEKCKKHGHFVLKDGFVAMEFCFTDSAVDMLNEAIKSDDIDFNEYEEVVELLMKCGLPAKHQDQDLGLICAVEAYNVMFIHAFSRGEKVDVDIHDFIANLSKGIPPEEPELGELEELRNTLEEKFSTVSILKR